ncbi:hypothetical protein CKO44_05405 [Rubrivivax gelatinosus]|uniref:DUF262 domain-containing protein n=1 Tax=Rubrivivax gelatinosus TaxID=28068 RepID=UPI0019076A1E|nr:DUF262 domain-containing protein [Rubrivivax gelatinosus]MBK1612906.1 hypothetical protein [Rubrivivax gelatinosus]MBZ8143052.1 hypothetical protein [Rubrivivax gelatinosus]
MKNILNQLEQERRKVDFDTFDISVKELVSMVEQGIIDIAPEYQRQFRWPVRNQSRFIESVYLGIPVPSLFMAANKDGSWELIDGVQRLSTLIHYAGSSEQRAKLSMSTSLRLDHLEVLSDFNASTFDDVPSTLRLKFILRPLKVTTLSDKSDLKVRFDLFERLNTGGVKLTDQEIRACVYRGRFNEFLSDLAQNEDFSACINLTEAKEHDGTKEEFVLRFFAYLYSRDIFEHSVVGFLNDYMAKATSEFNYRRNRELFERTFSLLRRAIPEGIRRGNRRTTPANLFEAVSVGAALAVQNGSDLQNSGILQWINDDDLTRLTSEASNNRQRVLARIQYCYDKFVR